MRTAPIHEPRRLRKRPFFSCDSSWGYDLLYGWNKGSAEVKNLMKSVCEADQGDSSWGYDLFCGWKQVLSWGEKLREKGAVKQTTSHQKEKIQNGVSYRNGIKLQTDCAQNESKFCATINKVLPIYMYSTLKWIWTGMAHTTNILPKCITAQLQKYQ